jgi:urea transport system substrate-binding protein
LKKKSMKLLAVMLSLAVLLLGCSEKETVSTEEGIKIGILFSLSGDTAVAEKPMANAALMAIEEINENGGINGEKLIPISEDYASNPSDAATKAKKLILQDKVPAIIGGFTTSSRKAMLPIVEEHDKTLVYTTIYEGLEYSKNIMYVGTLPNQQLQDFIPWLTKNAGKKFYFVGSDYDFPAEINNQVRELLKIHGGEVVGEEYAPLGHSEFSSILNKIKVEQPDLIFSTLVGNSVASFYKQYKSYGLDSATMPIASPVTVESDINAMGAAAAEGHITSAAYFQSTNTPENKAFVEKYQAKYGKDAPISHLVEATYNATHLLGKALEKVEDPQNSEELVNAFKGLELQAPQGKIKVDKENNHTWLNSRIGIVGSDGQFEILTETKEPIYPEPWAKSLFPDHKEPWKTK